MIAAKTAKGVSQVYLADLRYRLGVFKEAFHCDVSVLGPDDVAAFFERLRLSPRSYNNFLRTLRTFLAFAQNHGWLSKEIDLLARVEKSSETRAPVEIFTPSQLTALLKNASSELAPCFALACVCRTARRGNLATRLGGCGRATGIHRSRRAQSKDCHAQNSADFRQPRALAGGCATQCGARMAAQQGLVL